MLWILHMELCSRFVQEPEFKWSPETIGVVESSFFWGYILTQVPGGYLAARYPANKYETACSVLWFSSIRNYYKIFAGLEYRYSNIDITEIPKLFLVIF